MTGPSDKPEFPPLLPPGLRDFSVAELRALCVDAFPLSKTRKPIMEGLSEVLKRLCEHAIKGELWIDGSFLTQKIDPEDCDLVLRLRAEFYDNATSAQQEVVDWVGDNLKTDHLCDSYLLFEWDLTSPNYALGQDMHRYWLRQWGFSRGQEEKGIAVVQVPRISLPSGLSGLELNGDVQPEEPR